MNRRTAARAARIVTAARSQVGYRSQPNRQNGFSPRGFNGQAWNGAYLDRVLRTAFDAEPEVSFLSTVTALSYYVARHRVYLNRVRPGDIVFFNFASDPLRPFEQPHVGVVVESNRWKADGVLRTVEGETGPGVPQGSQLVDGVFERVRTRADILGFVRPEPRPVSVTDLDRATVVKMSYFNSNAKTRARAVEFVQTALNRITGMQYTRGKFDVGTKSALARYARERGTVSNRGELEYNLLHTLSEETGSFRLEK